MGVGLTVMLPAAAWLWAQGLWRTNKYPAGAGVESD